MRNVKQDPPASGAVYTIRLDRAHLQRMHEIAASEHRSLSGKLRLMIEREIARHDADADTGTEAKAVV